MKFPEVQARAGWRGVVVVPLKRADTHAFPQDEDSEFTLASDFEIGHFFRERIVPRAVLYFTGEAIEDEDNVRGLRGRGVPVFAGEQAGV